jgi:hypothetical protein
VPVSTWPSYFFTVNTNRTLVASFAAVCTIRTSASSASAGCTCGGGAYAIGSSINVLATPKTGQTFVNWTENGMPVSPSASYSFTGSSNRTLVANFAPNSAMVTFDFDTGAPTLTNGQTTPFGQTAGGLTAHFSSTNDPAFSVQSDADIGWTLSKFSTNYLAPTVSMSALDIQLSQPVTYINLTFATLDLQDILAPTTIQLAAYATSTETSPLGSTTAQGTYTPGDSMPMGALAFSSATPFQIVRISLVATPQGATDFAVDNITVQIAAIAVTPTLQSSGAAGGPFTDDLTATVDGAQKTITVATKDTSQFYRLRSTASMRIDEIRTVGGQVILKYE